MRRITSFSLICDTTNTRRVADENVGKRAMFRTFSPETRRVLVVSHIGAKEVILRIEMQLLRIHHFVQPSIAEYLIHSTILGFLAIKCVKQHQNAPAIKYMDIYATPK